MNIVEMRSELDRLKKERNNIEQTWDHIRRLIMPYRGEFFKENYSENSVSWRIGQDIFDSTAIVAAQTLAASLHSSLTSQATRWFDLKWNVSELNYNNDAAKWLEDAAQKMYDALQKSNFDLEVSETYLDLVGYGTSIIIEEVMDEDDGDINFQSIPVEQGHFVQGYKGNVVRFYREVKWTPTQIYSKFGDEGTPEHIKKMAVEGTSNDSMRVVYAIFERPEKMKNTGHPLAAKERPIGWCYYTYSDAGKLGEEGGFYEMPAFVPRWRRTNESQWGNGPAMIALPDTMTLNRLVEMVLKAAEKVIDPATITTERDLLSDLDLQAGGLTIVRDIENIRPYESRARFDVSQLRISELQSAINRVFHTDQLQLKESPAMTATEVQVRYELMQRLLGPTLGRLKTDFLDPLLQRTFNILYRAGVFQPLPADVTEEDVFNVEYTSPFARAQKMDVARSVMDWTAYLAQMAEMYPEMRDIPDPDKIARELASLTSVPARLIRNDDVVKKIRKQRAEEQEAARQQALAEQGSKTELNQAKAEQERQR